MGMVSGIAFAIAILYGSMSARAGAPVSGFDPARPELFIYGVRMVFRAAFLLCAAAIVLTLTRALKSDPERSPAGGK
jgi:hypothetical protein